jgi:hypothetical protein
VKKKSEVLIPFLEPQSWMSPLVRSLIPNMWFHVASLQVFRLTMWQRHIILENHIQTLELDWLLQTWRLHSKDPVGLTSYWRGLGRYCTSLLCPWINTAESYITIGFDKPNFGLLVLSWEADFNTTGGNRFKRQKLFLASTFWSWDMQWSRGVVLLPSYRPPGPPTRNRASQMVSILQNESGFRDVEKGDKDHCRFHGEWTIHLIPVILLICILILYISSSGVPFEGERLQRNCHPHL